MKLNVTVSIDLDVNINTDALMETLEELGWVRIPRKRTDIAIYQHKIEGRITQITIPLDEELSDYDEAMQDALQTIADFEQVDLETVAKKYSL